MIAVSSPENLRCVGDILLHLLWWVVLKFTARSLEWKFVMNTVLIFWVPSNVGNLYPAQSLSSFQGLFSVYSRFNLRYKLFECILIVMLTHTEKFPVERTFRLVAI